MNYPVVFFFSVDICIFTIFKIFGFKVKLSVKWHIALDASLLFLSVHPICDYSWNILPVQSSFIGFSVADAASRTWSYFPSHRSGRLCKIMLYIIHVIVKCNLKYFSMLTAPV